MNKLKSSPKIYISQSKITGAGRGVFAGQDIQKGEIIESCPIIKISENDTSNLGESILTTYFFYFGKKRSQSAITLGFGSIYNHSDQPNAKYIIKPGSETIIFVCVSDITKGDEITFNYYGSAGKSKVHRDPLWFEVGR